VLRDARFLDGFLGHYFRLFSKPVKTSLLDKFQTLFSALKLPLNERENALSILFLTLGITLRQKYAMLLK
jgi:hypothetical protein